MFFLKNLCSNVFFQATPGTGQLDTEVIADMVHCQLKHRFEDLQKPSATLMVESLFAEIPQVGFTLDGKVALLPDETESAFDILSWKSPHSAVIFC